MNQSVKYRQTASECREAARILSDPREKAKMLAMAQLWILLADQAERNSQRPPLLDWLSMEPKAPRGYCLERICNVGRNHGLTSATS
jgi:hypothetical protein